jgi:hypothetical protein|tara:strand:+ start:341 stop:481 length:141 start_codon:yes stop_codon:yes gene_type:complete
VSITPAIIAAQTAEILQANKPPIINSENIFQPKSSEERKNISIIIL